MADLCLVLDVVIPQKFKVHDFDRYKGTTCPKNHLKMYCRKMGAHSRDEKLLMHFFQDSLVEVAVIWYTNLEASCIRTWKDLITALLRQYQYNSDMTVAPFYFPFISNKRQVKRGNCHTLISSGDHLFVGV